MTACCLVRGGGRARVKEGGRRAAFLRSCVRERACVCVCVRECYLMAADSGGSDTIIARVLSDGRQLLGRYAPPHPGENLRTV